MNSVRGALLSDTLNLSPLQMVTKVAFLCVKTKKSANQKCRLSGGDATGEQRCQAPRLCLCHTSARKVEKNQTIKTHFCFNDLSTEDNNHTRLGTVLMFEISFLVSFVGQ